MTSSAFSDLAHTTFIYSLALSYFSQPHVEEIVELSHHFNFSTIHHHIDFMTATMSSSHSICPVICYFSTVLRMAILFPEYMKRGEADRHGFVHRDESRGSPTRKNGKVPRASSQFSSSLHVSTWLSSVMTADPSEKPYTPSKGPCLSTKSAMWFKLRALSAARSAPDESLRPHV